MITKRNGKTYEENELDVPAEKIKIRDRINEVNDLIKNEKDRRDTHISNIAKLQLEKDTLQAKLVDLNK